MERKEDEKIKQEVCRGRPREFNREEALRAALELFWRQGYIQTTMNQLCEAMGIKSPSLYCAFGNKADLFLEALTCYRKTYWSNAFKCFMEDNDLYQATNNLFAQTAEILLCPDAPCGCLVVYSAMTLPPGENKVLEAITKMRQETKRLFRERLMKAIKAKQIAADCDIPSIAGALTNFFEGLSLQARDGLCLSELKAIALRGVQLLPPRYK